MLGAQGPGQRHPDTISLLTLATPWTKEKTCVEYVRPVGGNIKRYASESELLCLIVIDNIGSGGIFYCGGFSHRPYIHQISTVTG